MKSLHFQLVRLLYIALLLFSTRSLAQEKYLHKAKKELEKGALVDAKEMLDRYKEKAGVTPEYQYILAQWMDSPSSSLTSYEEAYALLKTSFNGLKNYPAETQEDLCKSLNFCETDCNIRSWNLEVKIYQGYYATASVEKMNLFIEKYRGTGMYYSAVDFRDSLVYEEVSKSNSLRDYIIFVDNYPDSKLRKIAQEKIHELAYADALKLNTIEGYQKFLKEYPLSQQSISVQRKVEEIEFASAKEKNSSEAYRSFIKSYPGSSFTKEAREILESIEWNASTIAGSVTAYENFIRDHPLSAKRAEAERQIEELKKMALPYLMKNRKFRFYDVNKKTFVNEEEFDDVVYMKNGAFEVKKNDLYGIVNRKGQKIVPCKYECIGTAGPNYIVGLQNKFGILDSSGKSLTGLDYDGLQPDYNGFIISHKLTQSGDEVRYGLISVQGEQLVDEKYESVSVADSGRLIVKTGGLFYLCDTKGKLLSKGMTSLSANNYNPSYFDFKDVSMGLMDRNGQIKIPGQHKTLYGVDSLTVQVTNSLGKLALLDFENTVIIPFGDYDYYEKLTWNLYLMKKHPKYDMKSGRTLPGKDDIYHIRKKTIIDIGPKKNVSRWDENSILIDNGGAYRILDENGSMLFGYTVDAPAEEEAFDPEMGDAYAGDGEEYGCGGDAGMEFLDNFCYTLSVDQAIPIGLDSYGTPRDKKGLMPININSKYGYLNTMYEIAIPIRYSSAHLFNMGMANVTSEPAQPGESTIESIIDTTGKILLANYSVIKHLPHKKFALVKSTKGRFGKLNYKDLRLENLEEGVLSVAYYEGFEVVRYKDVNFYVYENENLKESGIDFTDYEASTLKTEGRLLFFGGQPNKAIEIFNRALAINKNDADTYYNISDCYKSLNDNYKAIENISKAITLQPKNTQYYYFRIELCKNTNDRLQIIKDYQNLLDLDISEFEKSNIYFNKGYTETDDGQYNQAILSYTRCLELSPTTAAAYNNRGICYSRTYRTNEALADYKTAIRLCPTSDKESLAMYYSNAGSIYISLNRKSEACAMFKKSSSLSNTYSRNYNSYCR